jgi:hypothetical protein
MTTPKQNEPDDLPTVAEALRYIARHPECARIMAIFAACGRPHISRTHDLTVVEVAEFLDFAIAWVDGSLSDDSA